MAFNKGSLARITSPALEAAIAWGDRWSIRSHEADIRLWRRATPADNEAWRANLAERARAAEARGEDTFSIYCDSAGESRLPPTDTYFSRGESWDLGTVVTIIRGRCRALSVFVSSGDDSVRFGRCVCCFFSRRVRIQR